MFIIESNLYAIILATITILAVLNPFGNLPQFISMTDGLEASIRKKLFRNIVFTAFCIVLIFLFSGPFIMTYIFNVTLDDVKVAGGLILIVMGLRNLLFSSTIQDYSQYQKMSFEDLFKHSIIPMSFPMLVGPGTLAAVIVISEEKNMFIAVGAVITAFIFIFILFHYAATIEKILGKLVLYVFSRIALVFIVAIGIKMLILGLKSILIL